MSTRLFIRNLPKNQTSESLRLHLTKTAGITLTDCKVLTTKEGQSRRIAFVGCTSTEDAETIKKQFHNTFVGTSKIAVEEALSKGDDKLKPWSKHSEGSSAFKRSHPEPDAAFLKLDRKDKQDKSEKKNGSNSKSGEKDGKSVDEDKLNEFLGLGKGKIWMNDDGVSAPAGKRSRTDNEIVEEDSDDEYEDLPVRDVEHDVAHDEHNEAKDDVDATAGKDNLSYFKSKAVEFSDDESNSDGDDASDDEKPEYQNDTSSSSNHDVLSKAKAAGRVPFAKSDGEKTGTNTDNTEEDEEDGNATTTEAVSSCKGEEVESEFDPKRLFLRNLPFMCTEDHLEALLTPFGEIEDIHIPKDTVSGKTTGFAYVSFMDTSSAEKSKEKLDGTVFMGRLLHILPAKKREEVVDAKSAKQATSSFKRKKEEKLKAQAKDQKNWNAAYMNPATVMESTAQGLGVEKSALVNAHGASVAVRVALAETALLKDTEELIKSMTPECVLVKNVPPNTSESELKTLFSSCGTVVSVRSVVGRAAAVVEFSDRNMAKKAFRGFAYKKFKEVPLFLEWGRKESEQKDTIPVVNQKEEFAKSMLPNEDADPSATRTLYVKNLNFLTNEHGLREFFAGCVAVVLKKGYGFVEFPSKEMAHRALHDYQGSVLDDHRLSISFSQAQSKSAVPAAKKITNTKLIVRNVAFEASEKDIRELFSAVGHLKVVRLPKKFDGSHRGFGFVEYLTPGEAAKAMDTLKNTHLYGRHLVIEWASNEQELATGEH
eukprot:ANDGO_01970.mRNA.1 Multiple RNA-binding domain-containing protein 1